jgi:hypothetical protein
VSPPREAAQGELDVGSMMVLATAGNELLPTEVLRHVNDLDLDPDVRRSLFALQDQGSQHSLRKISEGPKDILLISSDSREPPSKKNALKDETGIYLHGDQGTVLHIADLCDELAKSIDKWGKRNSIDVGFY